MSSISKDLTQTIKVIILATIIALSAQLVFAAWDPPPSSPPNDNAEAPLNVSDNPQIKGGGLTVNNNDQATYGLQVPYGESWFGKPQNLPVGSFNIAKFFGKIGADEYCDRNYANCTPANELGGGGSGGGGTETNFYVKEVFKGTGGSGADYTATCNAGDVAVGQGCFESGGINSCNGIGAGQFSNYEVPATKTNPRSVTWHNVWYDPALTLQVTCLDK